MFDRTTFCRPIAHRGLHDADAGLLENSRPAFEAAIALGYGIECDVQAAAGGLPIVFHDAMTDRLLGRPGLTRDLTPADLATLAYPVGGTRVLTLAEVLALVAGRVPLLVEIKSDWTEPDPAFLSAIASALSHYAGPLAVMSFDPAILAALAELTPATPRGLVSGDLAAHAPTVAAIGRERAERITRLEDADRLGIDLIAYDHRALPSEPVRHVRDQGVPVFAWTVRSKADLAHALAYADAPIFEGFRPDAPTPAATL